MGFLRSKTKEGPAPEPYNLPQTGYQFASPVVEDIGRRMLSSYFGAPGYYEGMISRPTPIPIEQTAGLTPLQMQARGLSQRLGGFGGQLSEAQDLYRQQAQAAQRGLGALEGGLGDVASGQEALTGALGGYQEARQQAMQAPGMAQPYFGEAQRYLQESVGGFDPRSGIGAYMDPYEDVVVQQTIRDITERGQLGDIGRRAQAVGSGAFGGARSRLQEEESQRALGRGLGEAIGGLRSRGYEGARQAAMGEYGRRSGALQAGAQGVAGLGSQQAGLQSGMAGQLANIAQGFGGIGAQRFQGAQTAGGLGQGFGQLGGGIGTAGAGIAGLGGQGFGQLQNQINLMNQLGQQGQATQQAGLGRQYRAATQMAEEPFMRMQRGLGMLQGVSPMMGAYTGGTGSQLGTTPTYQQPSTFSNVLGAAGQIAGIFASDFLLKDNVRKIGETDGGANVFAWNWNDEAKALGVDAQPEFGVIAQDLVQTHPEAVIHMEDGYLAVDYRKVS